MDESTLLFRGARRSRSSFNRPVRRSRSLSTLSTQHKPTVELSKIRDHDFTTNIEAKAQRLARSVSRPKRDEDSTRSRLHRSRSFGRHYQEDAGSSVLSSDDLHQVSPSHSVWIPNRHSSAVIRITQPPYAFGKLPTALQQKATRLLLKDSFDRDSLSTGRRFDRITSILEQLRHEDADRGAGGLASSSVDVQRHRDEGHRSSVRAELDSFAALISKLSPRSAAGISGRQTNARSDAEDFWTRLAHTRGDLSHLETLVRQTFGSSHPAVASNSPPPSVSVEPVFIFHDKKPSSHRDDVIAFITGESADYKKSDAVAEMAIQWAQERRRKVENELHGDREYEDHPGLWQHHLHTPHHEADYFEPDELQPSLAAVIHTSPTIRYHRSATVDLHGTSSSREPSTLHSYTRSESASVPGLHQRTDQQPASQWHPTSTFSVRPPMSEARKRARSVLAKHGRRLSRL